MTTRQRASSRSSKKTARSPSGAQTAHVQTGDVQTGDAQTGDVLNDASLNRESAAQSQIDERAEQGSEDENFVAAAGDPASGDLAAGDLDEDSAQITGRSLERREIPSFSDDRAQRIAERAYWRAEQRGFTPGQELDDWLEAEREYDASRDQPQDGRTG